MKTLKKIGILYLLKFQLNTIYFLLIRFLLGNSRNSLKRSHLETVQLKLTTNKLSTTKLDPSGLCPRNFFGAAAQRGLWPRHS